METKSKYIGHRVFVTAPGRYKNRAVGRFGVIKSYYSEDSIGVAVDDIYNHSSAVGYFYFKLSELELDPEENTEKHEEENKMPEIRNYLNIAVVQFLDAKGIAPPCYEYANFIPDLQVGDRCVVMSANHGLGLAEVVSIEPAEGKPLRREIVDRVHMADYNARVELRKLAAELQAKMQARAEQLQELALFQALAQNDPEMAKLVQAYQDLLKN